VGCLVRASDALGHLVLRVSEFVDAPFLVEAMTPDRYTIEQLWYNN